MNSSVSFFATRGIFLITDSTNKLMDVEVEVEETFPIELLLVLVTIALIAAIGFYFWYKVKMGHLQTTLSSSIIDHNRLSEREQQIFNELLKKQSLKEIADTLHIAVSTVKSHTNSIYKTLGVKSRKELIARFATHDATAHPED